jgi:hypothetical protein
MLSILQNQGANMTVFHKFLSLGKHQKPAATRSSLAIIVGLAFSLPVSVNAQACSPTNPACAPAPTGGTSGGSSVGVKVNPIKVIKGVGGLFKKKKKPVDAATTQPAKTDAAAPKTQASNTSQPKIIFKPGTGGSAPKPRVVVATPKPRVAVKATPPRQVAVAPVRTSRPAPVQNVKPVIRTTARKAVRAAVVVAPVAAVAIAASAEPVVEAVVAPVETPAIVAQPVAEVAAVAEPTPTPSAAIVQPETPIKQGFPAWLYGLGGLLLAGAAASALKMRGNNKVKASGNINVDCSMKQGGSRITIQSTPFVTSIPVS